MSQDVRNRSAAQESSIVPSIVKLRLRIGPWRAQTPSGVDPGLKEANQNRLRRHRGQWRRLQKRSSRTAIAPTSLPRLLLFQRLCEGVARNLIESLHHCASTSLKSRRKKNPRPCTRAVRTNSTRICEAPAEARGDHL